MRPEGGKKVDQKCSTTFAVVPNHSCVSCGSRVQKKHRSTRSCVISRASPLQPLARRLHRAAELQHPFFERASNRRDGCVLLQCRSVRIVARALSRAAWPHGDRREEDARQPSHGSHDPAQVKLRQGLGTGVTLGGENYGIPPQYNVRTQHDFGGHTFSIVATPSVR